MSNLVEFPCVFSVTDMHRLLVAVDDHGQQFPILSFVSVFSSGLCFAALIISESLNFANYKRNKIFDHMVHVFFWKMYPKGYINGILGPIIF